MLSRMPAGVLLLATAILWSLNFTAVKYTLDHGFEPMTYAAIRFSGAALLFVGITYGRERDFTVRRRDLWLLLGLAVVGVWINQISFAYAVVLSSSVATVALLFGTVPIFVAIFASASGVERLRPRVWLAAGISFSGVALVAVGSSGDLAGDLGGIFLTLVSAMTWAVYSVAVSLLMRRYSPYRISAFVLTAGAVLLLISAVPQFLRFDLEETTNLAWAALLYTLIGALVITNLLWFTAIKKVGAARSSIYVNIQPFLGAVFALVILSESIGAIQVVGGIVLGAAVVLAQKGEPDRRGGLI